MGKPSGLGGVSSTWAAAWMMSWKTWKVVPGSFRKPWSAPSRLALVARTWWKIGWSGGGTAKTVPPVRKAGVL